MLSGLLEYILWFGAGALAVGAWVYWPLSKKKPIAAVPWKEDAMVRTFGECAELMARENLITSLAWVFSNCFTWLRLSDGDMDLRTLLFVFMRDVEGVLKVASETEEYEEEDRRRLKRRLEEVSEFREYLDKRWGK